MRPMRRQDREIKDPEKILSIIAACPYCHLGFSDHCITRTYTYISLCLNRNVSFSSKAYITIYINS